jgi:hypothetical protein
MTRIACPRRRGAPGVQLLALASLLVAFAQAPRAAEPEYVPDVGPGSVSDPGLSGDGRIMAWADRNGATPTLYLRDLETGTQNTWLLRTTTGDADLDFPNSVGPSLSDDGTRIALVADRPGGGGRDPEALLVVDNNGTQLARVTASLGSGEIADFQDRAFISGDGRYVTFSGEGRRLESTGISGNGLLTFSDDFTIKTLRLEVATGGLTLAAFDSAGGLPNDDSSAQGISDNGQYVLFCSTATDLPAANGRQQAYRSDPGNGTLIQVSRDATGATVSEIYCGDELFEDEQLGISDSGQRVVYTESRDRSADGEDHTFIWAEGAGSREITGLQKYASLPISGDGRWLAPDDEPFSRLDIDTGTTDPVSFRIRNPRISDNGGTLLFFNDVLPRPAGQTGRWWVLRYATAPPELPPLALHIEERISIGERVDSLPGLLLAISEAVMVGDDTSSLNGVVLNISEPISVAQTQEGLKPAPSNIIELQIDAPLLPGDIFNATAVGFKPFSQVLAWLQSTPVLVGEETADAFGNVTFVITVPLTFPPGPHTLVLVGEAPDGSERRLEAPITVSARDENTPGTGNEGHAVPVPATSAWALLLLALCLLMGVRAQLQRKSAGRD